MALDLESESLQILHLKTEPRRTFSLFLSRNQKKEFILSIQYQSLHFERVTVTHIVFNLLFAFSGF